jgi:hypothetical protein
MIGSTATFVPSAILPLAALCASEAIKHEVRRNLAGLTNYFYEDYILPTLRAAE